MNYCDNCADPVSDEAACVVTSLVIDVDSANVGESAVLCPTCHSGYVTTVIGKARREIGAAREDEAMSRWPDVDVLHALDTANWLLASIVNDEVGPEPDINRYNDDGTLSDEDDEDEDDE